MPSRPVAGWEDGDGASTRVENKESDAVAHQLADRCPLRSEDGPVTATVRTDPERREAPAAPAPSAPPWHPTAASVLVSLLALVAVVLVLLGVASPVRAVVAAAAALTAPGLAVLPRRGRLDPWAAAGMVVVASMVIGVVVGLVSAWTGWWHPVGAGVALLLVSAAVLVVRDLRGRRLRRVFTTRRLPAVLGAVRRPGNLLPAGALASATALWILSLRATPGDRVAEWGLLPLLPWTFYGACALVLGVLIVGLVRRPRLANGWLGAHTALLVLTLYGTAGLLDPVPRLPWVFKHIAVVQYLELHGRVNPELDLYQRWPGFFVWAAQLAELVGRPDTLAWAGLAEPFFGLLGVLLVYGIARAVLGDGPAAWVAALLFALGNWINQNYFAPQGLAYPCYLFIGLVLLSSRQATPGRLGQRFEHLVERLCRRPVVGGTGGAGDAGGGGALTARLPTAWSVGAVLTAYAVATASHQLTPYLVLLVVGPLFLLGFLRPRWLVLALGAVAVGYLLPNLQFIESRFGVLSSFNPWENAVYSVLDRTRLSPEQVLSGRASYLISGLLYLTALVGVVRRVRHGGVRSAVMVGWMMSASALVLAVQSYGGEGRLRVYLFSLPWCAVAAAWAFWPGTGARLGRRAAGVLAALLTALAVLFSVSYFVTETEVRVRASDVAAARWVDQTSRPGDVVLITAPPFPLYVGAHYDHVLKGADLSRYAVYFDADLTRADLLGIAAKQAGSQKPPRVLVAFSDQQDANAARHALYGPGELSGLERQLSRSTDDRVVYAGSGVRIYQLG
jgi:hypothetical protein